MNFEFNLNNDIIKLCFRGISLEEDNKSIEADKIFFQAWNTASNDFEKFIAAYYIARYEEDVSEKIKWLEKSILFALNIDNEIVKSSLCSLYLSISKCYKELGDGERAKKNWEISNSYKYDILDKGPFYHGTRADLKIGDLLTAGWMSNYRSDVKMNHIYFTTQVNGAGLAASLAKGNDSERVYVVEPMGEFENDPNVTDVKFPGNPTRSYRSEKPLKIVGEILEWNRLTSEEIEEWKKKLEKNKGDIIN